VPNGEEKNWIRLCVAIEEFRIRYKRWPTHVFLDSILYESLTCLFSPSSLEKLNAKVELVVKKDALVVAADDQGNQYDYGHETGSGRRPRIKAVDWLGVRPDK